MLFGLHRIEGEADVGRKLVMGRGIVEHEVTSGRGQEMGGQQGMWTWVQSGPGQVQ